MLNLPFASSSTRRAGVELLANGKLSKTLSYNASGTLLWNRIDPRIAGISTPRSGTTGTVRANLTWQPTARDYFQLNASYSGDQLIAQGYRKSGGVLNLGYRRKIDERFNLILSAQNVLDSVRQKIVIDTPLIRDRLTQRGNGQTFLLSLSYTLGSASGKKRQEPGFDFDGGGNVAQ
ncbi:MAG: hypothetical protein EOP59_15795 [Sphingomonadales bacterium]|nr:MAG: hypothetical protein EOP59_15795 [Sphingomonadales bacterium]